MKRGGINSKVSLRLRYVQFCLVKLWSDRLGLSFSAFLRLAIMEGAISYAKRNGVFREEDMTNVTKLLDESH
jgi:hypothetical protein